MPDRRVWPRWLYEFRPRSSSPASGRGNHGRGTLKPRAKNRVPRRPGVEHLLPRLADVFPVVIRGSCFMCRSEADAFFKVFDHRFLLTHGDSLGVKGGDGLIGALGPIARGTLKIGKQAARIGRDFDTLLMGHWHAYMPRGELCR